MPWSIAVLVVLGLLLLMGVQWARQHARGGVRRARRSADGTQEMRVVVRHGYHPSRIGLEAGVPANLRFERREDDPCTELLVSELWPTAHRLVAHGETEVRFTPQRIGRFVFTCGLGLYTGELLVQEGRRT